MSGHTEQPALRRRPLLIAAAAAAATGTARAQAQPVLRFAVTVVPTTMDPHFHSLTANHGPLQQIYEPLVFEDEAGRTVPMLAESWEAVSDDTWVLRLRKGVQFHDGTPFTAEDVVFSFDRVPNVPNSPGLFTSALSAVRATEIIDAHTVRIHTREPSPFLLRQLPLVSIISARIHRNATTADFNDGRLAIGTGPYRFGRYVPGEVAEFVASDSWWGGRPAWSRVVMRQISSGSSRVAALLAGDVDLIENVPFADVPRLRRNPEIGLHATPPSTTYYIALDSARDASPYVNGGNAPNPLRDARVRRALSVAIDRRAIAERVMEGLAMPAGQYAPSWAEGFDPDLPEMIPYDPNQARELLAAAGHGGGFAMTLHGTQGWVAQDQALLQAVAQFWNRVGVRAELQTLPVANYLARATRREFSAFFGGSGASYAAHHLRGLVMTRDIERGNGVLNRLQYSSPMVDAALAAAYRTLDTEARNAQIRQATRAALEDSAVLPIVYVSSQWAGRKRFVSYRAHVSGRSMAMLADPVAP